MEMTFKELDELKDHLAQCLSVGIEKQIAPIVAKCDTAVAKIEGMEARVAAHAEEISKLKGTQAKALAVWTMMITAIGAGVTFGFNWIWNFVKSHVNLHS